MFIAYLDTAQLQIIFRFLVRLVFMYVCTCRWSEKDSFADLFGHFIFFCFSCQVYIYLASSVKCRMKI